MRRLSCFQRLAGAVAVAVLVLALLAKAGLVVGADTDPATVRIGVLAYMGDEAAVNEWAPVAAQISGNLPGRGVELLSLDHASMEAAVRDQQVDFVITNPGHYVELESALGAARLLTLHSGGGVPGTAAQAVGAAVVTLAGDGSIQRLEDLRGKRVAIVGREGFSGYQVVWRELAALGIDTARELELQEVGLPMDRVLAAVASGEADAGFVRACMIESRPAWRSQFRVVAPRRDTGFACASSTRLYPNWPIASLRHTDPALARAVTLALLAMRTENSPIAWTVPAEYQAVHELQRELGIGAYADLSMPTLTMLLQRYWPWLAGLVGVFALGGLYTAHVEAQVHARTQALRAAAREREALENRLRASREQAEHMARLSVLGELSGTLAHELNQPLAAIGNYAQSLIRRADTQRLSEAAVREAAAEMAGQAERAAGILGRIRAFARKRVAQMQAVEPLALVEDAVALFRGMLGGEPEVIVSHALPAGFTVEADALQIQQVLLNLLKNGWDATRSLPPARQRLTVRLGVGAGGLQIAVRDLGETLDEAAQARLFEPFFTTKPDGMGLGLAICRTIAEAHGGRLDASAAPDGPGLIFTLTLPC